MTCVGPATRTVYVMPPFSDPLNGFCSFRTTLSPGEKLDASGKVMIGVLSRENIFIFLCSRIRGRNLLNWRNISKLNHRLLNQMQVSVDNQAPFVPASHLLNRSPYLTLKMKRQRVETLSPGPSIKHHPASAAPIPS